MRAPSSQPSGRGVEPRSSTGTLQLSTRCSSLALPLSRSLPVRAGSVWTCFAPPSLRGVAPIEASEGVSVTVATAWSATIFIRIRIGRVSVRYRSPYPKRAERRQVLFATTFAILFGEDLMPGRAGRPNTERGRCRPCAFTARSRPSTSAVPARRHPYSQYLGCRVPSKRCGVSARGSASRPQRTGVEKRQPARHFTSARKIAVLIIPRRSCCRRQNGDRCTGSPSP
jgi:hypothetical protein